MANAVEIIRPASLHSSGTGLYPLLSFHICSAALTHARKIHRIFLSARFHTCCRPMNLATRPHILLTPFNVPIWYGGYRSSGGTAASHRRRNSFVACARTVLVSCVRLCNTAGYLLFGIRFFSEQEYLDCYASLKIDYRTHFT